MAGIEKIINEIREEAKAAAQAVIEQAKAEAERLTAEAEREADQRVKEIQRSSRQKQKELEERSASAAELERRRSLLKAKQQLISDVLLQAKETMCGLPAGEYFDTIGTMIVSAAHRNESGKLCLSEKDRARLPEDFMEKLGAMLPEGSRLVLSPQAADISGGFILDYDGVEENGSFDAVFSARKEQLQDKVHAILF